jgi:hypothetical protein
MCKVENCSDGCKSITCYTTIVPIEDAGLAIVNAHDLGSYEHDYVKLLIEWDFNAYFLLYPYFERAIYMEVNISQRMNVIVEFLSHFFP